MGIAVTHGKVLGVSAYFFRLGDTVVAIDGDLLTEEMKQKGVVRFPLLAEASPPIKDVVWLKPHLDSSQKLRLLLVEGSVEKRLPSSTEAVFNAKIYGYVTYQNGGAFNCWFVGVPEYFVKRFLESVEDNGFALL